MKTYYIDTMTDYNYKLYARDEDFKIETVKVRAETWEDAIAIVKKMGFDRIDIGDKFEKRERII